MSVETYKVELSTPSPPSSSAPEVKTPKEGRDGQSLRERERIQQAEAIIRRNTFWALGAGAVTLPLVDLLAGMAVQLKLIKNLSDLYGVKFSEGLAMKLLSALVMGTTAPLWGVSVASLIKLIPGVGSSLGMVAAPLTVAAFTHALGRVFVLHFEMGGTLLNFKPEQVREHLQREYDRSMNEVVRMREDGPSHEDRE